MANPRDGVLWCVDLPVRIGYWRDQRNWETLFFVSFLYYSSAFWGSCQSLWKSLVSAGFWPGFFQFQSLSLNCESKTASVLACCAFLFPFWAYMTRLINHWRFPADMYGCLPGEFSPTTWFALDGDCLVPCKLSNSTHHQQLTVLLC